MKKYRKLIITVVSILLIILVLSFSGCSNRTLDDIIEDEPSMIGVVETVYDNYVTIYCEKIEGYSKGTRCNVPLDVECTDSYTNVNVGDEIVVYHNGVIAESDPLQIGEVYAITLRTPVDRAGESEKTEKEYHDLTSEGSVDVTDAIEKGEIFIVSQPIGTNSTEISIKNESEATVTVYLYNETDMNEPIMQMSLGKDKTNVFSGLTSRFVYYIGVLADESIQLDLLVTD